jgi:hypothetical protein
MTAASRFNAGYLVLRTKTSDEAAMIVARLWIHQAEGGGDIVQPWLAGLLCHELGFCTLKRKRKAIERYLNASPFRSFSSNSQAQFRMLTGLFHA